MICLFSAATGLIMPRTVTIRIYGTVILLVQRAFYDLYVQPSYHDKSFVHRQTISLLEVYLHPQV